MTRDHMLKGKVGWQAPRQPAKRYKYPPPAAAAGFALSLAGALVELVWWLLQNDHGWRNVYRFLQTGAVFWWSLGLSTAGALLTACYWMFGRRSRWWAAPGLLMTAAGLIRLVVGLLLLLVIWLVGNYLLDLVGALPEPKRRRHRHRG